MSEKENRIDLLRDRIEQIDGDMAALFEQRMECAAEIAAYKREKGLPILDKGREKVLIERNSKKLSNRELEPYYREFLTGMMDISKKYQHRLSEGLRVAYSGIEGSFASICTGRLFPEAERIPYKCFADAYHAVSAGECDLAVLPIENSFAGEVGQVADLMFDGDLFINGVYELPVSQCLLGVPGATADSIKTVISHPQALDQCAGFIRKHGYEVIAAENTARAAKQVADRGDITVGSIASSENAELYGLSIIDHDINESAQNTTRFAVFSKSADSMKNDDEYSTFILMFTIRNEAGTLAETLSILGRYGYSMRVIRSRPLKDSNWQYYFYTEVEGRLSSENGEKMLADLKKNCEFFKILGTYKPGMRV